MCLMYVKCKRIIFNINNWDACTAALYGTRCNFLKNTLTNSHSIIPGCNRVLSMPACGMMDTLPRKHNNSMWHLILSQALPTVPDQPFLFLREFLHYHPQKCYVLLSTFSDVVSANSKQDLLNCHFQTSNEFRSSRLTHLWSDIQKSVGQIRHWTEGAIKYI